MGSSYKINILTIAFLFCSAFLEYKTLTWPIYVYATSAFIFGSFVMSFNRCREVKVYYIVVIVIILTNVISSMLNRGQSPLSTLYASNILIDWFFFYVVAFVSPNKEELDNFVQRVIKIVLVAYYVQLAVYPIAIWGTSSSEWIKEDIVTYRAIVVGCQHAISLGIFYYFAKYLNTKSKISLVMFILCLSTLIIRSFRMMSLAAVVSLLFLYLTYYSKKRNGFSPFRMVGIFIIVYIVGNVLYMTVPIIHDNISMMIERFSSENMNIYDEDYIRTITIGYYYTEFFQSPWEMFFGSGLPSTVGQYGTYVRDTLISEYKYNYVDWGLIGLSWFTGIPLILSIIYAMVKAIKARVNSKLLFVGAWFVHTLIISITDPEAYQHHAFLVESIVLYMVYLQDPNFLKLRRK